MNQAAYGRATGETFVAVKGEYSGFAKVSLDFEPDWALDAADGRPEDADDGECFDSSRFGYVSESMWEVIGECLYVYQCFYLTARSALLLKQLTPGTSVYRRVGVFFEIDTLRSEGFLKEKTLKVV